MVPDRLPQHLYWLCRDACRQDIKPVPGLMTAVDINFYILSWAFAFYSTNDKDHAYVRLERVYRLRHAQPLPEKAKVYDVPLTAPLKRCSSCNASIYWATTDRGKAVPVNVNGQSHFQTCPHAKQHSGGREHAAA